MAKKKTCPACRAEVDADEQHCPNCPHSFFQEEGVQEERRGRSKEPVLWFVGGILFFFAAWRVLNFVIKYANADSDKDIPLAATVERYASTTTAAGAGAGAQGALSPEQQAQEQVRTALASGRVKVVTAEGVPLAQPEQEDGSSDGSAADQATVLVAPTAPSAPPKEWRLRGHVYDLVTLKPLAHATIVFKDAELERHFELETGADGRYRTIIPSLPGRGYAVAISRPDYTVSYLDPRTDVRGKTRRQRVQMAEELTHGMDEPYSVEAVSRAPVETDFYLAPLNPK